MWTFTPPNPYLWIYSILGLGAVFGMILFPLWPFWMRKGVWYLSTGLLCLIGLFFALAIVRLIIYVCTLIFMPRQFWLFPNLFADVGFIDSFIPLYGWEDPKALKGKKGKKAKTKVDTEAKTKAQNGSTAAPAPSTNATSKPSTDSSAKNDGSEKAVTAVDGAKSTTTTGAATETKATKRVATMEEVTE
ncbi:unnamed protein product [Ambrosiozyma monospora]|uniref:Translocation protein SEC62 n=1 Tax=Ambrosiozyma monospora TaxID=43982 RepID=A0A9W6SZV1_AMBMO|nr:unnamed protein product [Ambrosiozyma monospora]